ncbi:Nuclear control of ATPase protein 2 [Sorochytrium milnesiophthora]
MSSSFISDAVTSLSESLADIAEYHANKLTAKASSAQEPTQDMAYILQQIYSLNSRSPDKLQAATTHVLASYRTSYLAIPSASSASSKLAPAAKLTPTHDFLHWVFTAKVTVGAYQHVLQSLLRQTLRVSDEIYWWKEVNPYLLTVSALPNQLLSNMMRMPGQVYETVRSVHLGRMQLSQFQLLDKTRNDMREHSVALERAKAELATAIGYLFRQARFEETTSSTVDSLKGRLSEMIHALITVATAEFGASEPCFDEIAGKQVLTLEEALNSLNVVLLSIRPQTLPTAIPTVSQLALQTHGRPKVTTLYWLPVAVGITGSLWLAHRYRNVTLEDMVAGVVGAYRFVVNGITDWVIKPMRDIYETVRHRERRLAIMGTESLQNDLQSLERMVIDYASARGKISEADLPNIIEHVRAGDISLVLDDYENEIHRPIASALTGPLITLMLIQVQKTKVDVELAMSALDKLLRSNELNFAFLAVLPTMGITFAAARWVSQTLSRKKGMRQDVAQMRVKRSLWSVERTLTVTADDTADSGNKELGLLLVELNILRQLSQSVKMSREERERLLADIREMERAMVSNERKLKVVDRMYRNYSFLRPY